MKKPFRNLENYQLFFEEISTNLYTKPGSEHGRKPSDDTEKAPCLNESQIHQLREDLRSLNGDKESPSA